MNSGHIVRYLLAFLLGEDHSTTLCSNEYEQISAGLFAAYHREPHAMGAVGYTAHPEEMKHYRVVIIPSGFFNEGCYGHPESLPSLPLSTWHGTPILYGTPQEERVATPQGEQIIIHADIIASSFFLISRYEEMIRREKRDAVGRFPGKESLPYKAGFLMRPIIDEYAVHLRELLGSLGIKTLPIKKGFSWVHLTHDIDQPWAYYGWRSVARARLKEKLPWMQSISLAMGNILADKYFSFPRFLEWNREVKRTLATPTDTIFFFKTPGKHPLDKPNYTLQTRPIRSLLRLARKYQVKIGLHVNLTASEYPQLIEREKHRLEYMLRGSITSSRHHFLAIREPEDYVDLYSAGIRDDFTMGYADVAGFRLGTCRPVRFINPSTGFITKLVLHPLPFMDYTLHSAQYMNLNYEEALQVCSQCIETAFRYRGEVNLLFHNENLSLDEHPYHVRLYRDLLRLIIRCDAQARKDAQRPEM